MAKQSPENLSPVPYVRATGDKYLDEKFARAAMYHRQVKGIEDRLADGVIVIKDGHRTRFKPSKEGALAVPLRPRAIERRKGKLESLVWCLESETAGLNALLRKRKEEITEVEGSGKVSPGVFLLESRRAITTARVRYLANRG